MDWTSITALCAATTLFGGTLGAFAHHSYSRGGFDKDVSAKAQSAENLASAALAKIEIVSDKLHEYQILTTASLAEIKTTVNDTSRAQVAAEHRMAKALEDFGHAINNMTARIDQMLLERR